MGRIGNRPDCAYFLLLGLCGAAFLLTIGGILCYIAFNPDAVPNEPPHSALVHMFHHGHHHHYANDAVHPHSSHHTTNNKSSTTSPADTKVDNNRSHESKNGSHVPGASSRDSSSGTKQNIALAIVGPLCLLMGIFLAVIIGGFALKYDCDHEPEPNIAFLRLRSEMSLAFDPEKNNYELLIPATSSGTLPPPLPLVTPMPTNEATTSSNSSRRDPVF